MEYSYDFEKGQIERTLPNGIKTKFTYSSVSLLTKLRHEDSDGQLISEYQYDYNAAGKVVAKHELNSDGLKTTGYTWDSR